MLELVLIFKILGGGVVDLVVLFGRLGDILRDELLDVGWEVWDFWFVGILVECGWWNFIVFFGMFLVG